MMIAVLAPFVRSSAVNPLVVVTNMAEPSSRTCSDDKSRMAGVSRNLQMPTGRIEVTRGTARRRDRVGLALTDRVDVQTVEPGCQSTFPAGLDGNCGVPAGERDLGRG